MSISTQTSKGIAIVTGGSRGIGAGISKRLARDGYHVVVNYQSSAGKAHDLVAEIQAENGSAEALGFNVGNAEEVEKAFAGLAKHEAGPLAVLVNNAGISIDGLILRMKPEDLQNVLQTNLVGAVFCAKEAAKLMMKQRKGSIIQIGSVVGEMGNAGQVAYASAKAGMIGLTKSLAKEIASRTIRVNCITPGYIQTDMTDALTPAQKEAIVANIPLGSLGTTADVADLVAFLAGDQSRYITGQVIGINGGLYI